jgi:Zn-dependent protease with chaperone function
LIKPNSKLIMKKNIQIIIAVLLSYQTLAQVEVPISYTKPAFLMIYKEPYKQITFEFVEDVKDYYSTMDMNDSVMVFKNENQYRKYDRDLKNYYKAIENEKEDEEKAKKEAEKALKEGKKPKEFKKKELTPPSLAIYLNDNHKILRTGLDLKVTYEEYRISKKVIVKYIIITTDLEANDDYTGVFERLDGEIATIDGRAVKLKEKTVLKGKEGKGFEGKTFTSFKDMMLGSIVNIKGVRYADGILIADKGEVWEDSEDDLDRQIKTSLKNSMKLSANEVTFSDSKFELIQNTAIQTYVSKIGRAMIPQYQKDLDRNHPARVDFNFYVVKDSSFNACAYPDGSIFIHSTLLEELENEAQLGAILGHEIAHVILKHSRKGFQNKKAVGAGSDILKKGADLFSKKQEQKTGKESFIDDAANLITAFGGPALVSKYGRDLENQADRNGLTYMANAGYDPREAAKVWKRLSTLTDNSQPNYYFGSNLFKSISKGVETIYASHPESVTRYKNLNKLLAQNTFEGKIEDRLIGKEEYAAFKKGLKRVLGGKEYDEPVEVAKPKEEIHKPLEVVAPTKVESTPSKPVPKPKAPVKKKN